MISLSRALCVPEHIYDTFQFLVHDRDTITQNAAV